MRTWHDTNSTRSSKPRPSCLRIALTRLKANSICPVTLSGTVPSGRKSTWQAIKASPPAVTAGEYWNASKTLLLPKVGWSSGSRRRWIAWLMSLLSTVAKAVKSVRSVLAAGGERVQYYRWKLVAPSKALGPEAPLMSQALNVLKSNTQITVDRRPLSAATTATSAMAA